MKNKYFFYSSKIFFKIDQGDWKGQLKLLFGKVVFFLIELNCYMKKKYFFYSSKILFRIDQGDWKGQLKLLFGKVTFFKNRIKLIHEK